MRSRTNMLAALLHKISGPRDAAVLLSGAPGSGKSWVLDELDGRLGSQPHVMIRTSPSEADWPLSGLMLLLSNMELSRPIDLEPFVPDHHGEEVDTFALARYLQATLPERMTPGTVVLIDDLDRMDRHSLKVISFLTTKMQHVRTKFVCTVTLGLVPEELGAMQVIKLRELTTVESLQLAREHAGPQADQSVLDMVTTRSRGNPGALLAQLEMLPTRQLEGVCALCIPLHPTDEHLAHLERVAADLDPSQLELLLFSAMAPALDRVALLEVGVERSALDEMIHAGWIEPVGAFLELADPSLRSALYWSLETEQRRVLHAQLEPAAQSPALRLFHRSFGHDQRVSAPELLRGALQLVEQGQVGAAVELAERALNLAGNEPGLPAVLAELAHHLIENAALSTASRYLRFAQQFGPDAPTELSIAHLQVEIATAAGRPVPAVRVAALVHEHRQDQPIACGRLLSTVACAHAMRENSEPARNALQEAEQLLAGAPDESLLRLRHASVLLAALDQDHAKVLGEHQRLLGSANGTGDVEEKLSLALALLNIGYHHEAREILARVYSTDDEPNLLLQRLTLLLSATNAIMNENIPRAMSLVERWIAADGPLLLEPLPQLIQAWYWMHKGRSDMAGIFFDQMQPHVMGEVSPRAMARIIMLGGDEALMNGQYERAVENYRRALRHFPAPADLRYVKATTGLIEALVMLGRTEDAVNEYRSRQHQMSSVPSRRAKMTMRLAQALVLEHEASLARFQSLVDEWTPSDSAFELARVRHALGNRLRSMGQSEAARGHLVAARSLYRSLGARAWVANVEDCLTTRAPANGNGAPVDLSREEFQVVRMVHEGLTNKAIAKELYISVSAVEARLTKLYRRTGAKNRQQLASRFVDVQSGGGA